MSISGRPLLPPVPVSSWDRAPQSLLDLDDPEAEAIRTHYLRDAVPYLFDLYAALCRAAALDPGMRWLWPSVVQRYHRAHTHILNQGPFWWRLREARAAGDLIEEVAQLLDPPR